MKDKYGKLRSDDIPLLEPVVELFKKYNLQAGLHGTSLWNSKYKDVDLLVVSSSNDVSSFKAALRELKQEYEAEVLVERGNDKIGLDYDIKIGSMVLHLSFVVLL